MVVKRFLFVPRPPCKHCHDRPVAIYRNKRGLCDTCDRDISLRHMYPLPDDVARFAVRGIGNDVKRAKKAKRPTSAEPGSETKIEIMALRVLAGEELHHPLDVRCSPITPVPWIIPTCADNRRYR